MPFNGAGTFARYTPGTPYVNNTTIDETVVNAELSDVATGLSNCVTRDGQSPATANLPMGTFRHTNVGNATTRAAITYASAADVQDNTLHYLTATAGTNTVTATAAISMTAYGTGQLFEFTPANTNSGATTININSIGAKNVFAHGVACVGGEAIQNMPCVVIYDGTQFHIVNPRATRITNSLGSDVALNNTAAYFNGPTVATGTTGTWFYSGKVTVWDTAGAALIDVKLTDGTTVIDSAQQTVGAASNPATIAVSGYLTTPAGSVTIQVKDLTSTSGHIKFNLSGNSKDSTLSAFRIG